MVIGKRDTSRCKLLIMNIEQVQGSVIADNGKFDKNPKVNRNSKRSFLESKQSWFPL